MTRSLICCHVSSTSAVGAALATALAERDDSDAGMSIGAVLDELLGSTEFVLVVSTELVAVVVLGMQSRRQ